MTRYDYDNYFRDIIDEMVDKCSCIKYPIIDRENKLKPTPKITTNNTTLSTENNDDDDDDGYKKIPQNIVVEYECKLKQPVGEVIELQYKITPPEIIDDDDDYGNWLWVSQYYNNDRKWGDD